MRRTLWTVATPAGRATASSARRWAAAPPARRSATASSARRWAVTPPARRSATASSAWWAVTVPALRALASSAGTGLLVMGLVGCQGFGGGDDPGKAADSRLPATPSGYGAVFLDVRECSSYGKTPREISCASERAAARVAARYDGPAGSGPSCPATTDFVLHLSQSRPSSDENGDGVVPRGYACMRNLTAPHPGDPGGGGGPHTVVGDCVRGAGGGQVKEAPCDGSGDRAPEFKVVRAVTARAQCPPATRLYVQLDGGRPVGCARPV